MRRHGPVIEHCTDLEDFAHSQPVIVHGRGKLFYMQPLVSS